MTTKQEGDGNENKFPNAAASSSREWSAFRNPRIVRVSRSFGGKDRHSKVCTIRGLRDRRIRLSVPTAIQLYDLQDRLGLSQPSKVIDWLIDATKNDIDKLPPLHLPQGFGYQFHQQMLLSNGSTNNNNNDNHGNQDQDSTAKFKYWEAEASLKNIAHQEKGKWIRTNDQDGGFNCNSAQNLFPLTSNHSSLPNLLSNPLPYYHWDASNLSLSQFGPHHGFLPQSSSETSLNSNTNNNPTVPLPSSLAFSSNNAPTSHQFFFCPPATMSSLFPQYPPYSITPLENEWRDINHFQLLNPSGSQHMALPTSRGISSPKKNFSLNVNHGFAHAYSTNNNERQSVDKDS
ncbi:hypothetical protein JCGZ_11737 [Jatropha curcas]|uniref:TCP domain-containing protein n=1 Tax=Jatropha curcas TaxID=180498 RepID=A0A067K556_JATCU|nr:transcription factor TCP5 [Jatropha curcas]KDP31361.1 hypothetical protein JCGZ_11737 [Jatropha curcas]